MLPRRPGARFALEALFLVLLAVAAGLADLRPLYIVLIMVGAWILVALAELTAERVDPSPLSYLLPSPEPREDEPEKVFGPRPEERTIVAPLERPPEPAEPEEAEPEPAAEPEPETEPEAEPLPMPATVGPATVGAESSLEPSLGGRLRSLLGIVTAFTIAHSITLALAILGVVVIPPAVVEPVIALSIAYVALENIVREQAASGRWLVSFVFGLVHGFGFAGALLELGLPPGGILSSLLFFNLGVEAGQALVVAALFPALLWFGRFAWERRAVTAISTAVLVAAMALAIERVLFAHA